MLAEHARVSREAVSALERGERRYPRADTVEFLADALALVCDERAALQAAAERPARPRPIDVTGHTVEVAPGVSASDAAGSAEPSARRRPDRHFRFR